MKICDVCHIDKDDGEFHKNASDKSGLSSTCKECAKDRARKWYINNSEHAKLYQKQFRESEHGAEYRSEYEKEYRSKNRERIKRTKNEWKKRNKDRVKESNKKSRIKRREENADYILAQKRATESARRARKYNLPSDFTKRDAEFCYFYWGYKCAICGGDDIGMDLDHWIPISYSGKDNPGTVVNNIVPLCSGENGCNNSKHDRMPKDWLIWKFGEDFASKKLKEIDVFFQDATCRRKHLSVIKEQYAQCNQDGI